MRISLACALTALSFSPALSQQAPVHHYGENDRYAGCLFGEIVPMVRRGTSRDKALSIALKRCEAFSAQLTKRQVEDAIDYVNFSIDMMER